MEKEFKRLAITENHEEARLRNSTKIKHMQKDSQAAVIVCEPIIVQSGLSRPIGKLQYIPTIFETLIRAPRSPLERHNGLCI